MKAFYCHYLFAYKIYGISNILGKLLPQKRVGERILRIVFLIFFFFNRRAFENILLCDLKQNWLCLFSNVLFLFYWIHILSFVDFFLPRNRILLRCEADVFNSFFILKIILLYFWNLIRFFIFCIVARWWLHYIFLIFVILQIFTFIMSFVFESYNTFFSLFRICKETFMCSER